MKLVMLAAAVLIIFPCLALAQPSQIAVTNDVTTEQIHEGNSKAVTDDECTQLRTEGDTNSPKYLNKCLTEEEKILYNEQATAHERSQQTIRDLEHDFKDPQRDMRDRDHDHDHDHDHDRKKDDRQHGSEGN